MEEFKKFCYSEETEEQNAGEGVTRKVLSYSNNIMVCELHFEKGSIGSMHTHVHEQITYVVSGKFEVTVDGEVGILKAGDTVYEKSNALHGMKCLEEGVIIDVFSPKRDDFLK